MSFSGTYFYHANFEIIFKLDQPCHLTCANKNNTVLETINFIFYPTSPT